jgi:hypothetical protein
LILVTRRDMTSYEPREPCFKLCIDQPLNIGSLRLHSTDYLVCRSLNRGSARESLLHFDVLRAIVPSHGPHIKPKMAREPTRSGFRTLVLLCLCGFFHITSSTGPLKAPPLPPSREQRRL